MTAKASIYVKIHLVFVGFWLLASSVQAQQVLSLDQAIALGQQNDPWLHGSELKEKAMLNRSIAANTMEDPRVSLALLNLPTDGLHFDQEGMTQLKIGVSQRFPRGDSLNIKAHQLKLAADKFPLLRADRKAKITRSVSELWLDAYLAQQTIELIEKDRTLFEQMAEVAKASYSSVVGKTRQQDVIRAQLEIIQLDDRLTVQKQQLETSLARLNQWLHRYNHTGDAQAFNYDHQPSSYSLATALPTIQVVNSKMINTKHFSRNNLAKALQNHPAIAALAIKQQVAKQEVSLSKQQYQPQWGVNASYGYRDDMPTGESRADLFSVGVSFDLPLFTENKQDKNVNASIAESEAIKTETLLLTKQMLSEVEKELKQLKHLSDRQQLYMQQLLKQTHDQAEASLTAYTNDDGDFSEVVRARIAELNARISALAIDVNALKTIARINYLLTQYTPRGAQ